MDPELWGKLNIMPPVPPVPPVTTPITRSTLRELLAAAWDEGFQARADSIAQDVPSPPNPYDDGDKT